MILLGNSRRDDVTADPAGSGKEVPHLTRAAYYEDFGWRFG